MVASEHKAGRQDRQRPAAAVAHASLTRQMWDQYGATGVVKGVEA